MRRNLFFLAAGSTIAMLLAALAVTNYSASMTVAFLAVVFVFVILAGLLVWPGNKHKGSSDAATSDSRTGLKWLSIPFGIGAIGALVMALHEGWNVGDTIGAIFVGVFALLMAYELLRRRRTRRPQENQEP